jgi:hypothetical protein
VCKQRSALKIPELLVLLMMSRHSADTVLLRVPKYPTSHFVCACTVQAEPDILVTTGSDRGIALYDLRSGEQTRRVPSVIAVFTQHILGHELC